MGNNATGKTATVVTQPLELARIHRRFSLLFQCKREFALLWIVNTLLNIWLLAFTSRKHWYYKKLSSFKSQLFTSNFWNTGLFHLKLSRDMTKPTKWLHPSEDSDQPGHSPRLIRVFAASMKKAWVLSYLLSAQRRLWSGWADAQADLSLRWAHSHFVDFVMWRLKSFPVINV